jgi:hypothetical protein
MRHHARCRLQPRPRRAPPAWRKEHQRCTAREEDASGDPVVEGAVIAIGCGSSGARALAERITIGDAPAPGSIARIRGAFARWLK